MAKDDDKKSGKNKSAKSSKSGKSGKDKGSKEAQSAPETGSDDVETFVADLASMDQIRTLADALIARYPSIHVLVNNAGLLNTRFTETVDGIEATRILKNYATTRDVPVLILIPADRSDHQTFAFDSGAADVLSKPVNASALAKKTRSLLDL